MNDEDLDNEISVEEFQNSLPEISSIKLCEIIISHRYLGLYQELSILCMEELIKRRSSGDNFDFESYIDDMSKDLPEVNISFSDFNNILQQISKGFK